MLKQSIDNLSYNNILLYQESIIKVANSLAKRTNPYSRLRETKKQYAELFNQLSSTSLDKGETVRRNNSKDFQTFAKLSFLDITENPKVIDVFVILDIRFVQYKECLSDSMCNLTLS